MIWRKSTRKRRGIINSLLKREMKNFDVMFNLKQID